MTLYDIKVRKLKTFIELAEGRDPTKTLDINYRCSCRHIQDLEEVYGYVLFEGTRKKINLTEEGKIFLESAKIIVAEINKLDNMLIIK